MADPVDELEMAELYEDLAQWRAVRGTCKPLRWYSGVEGWRGHWRNGEDFAKEVERSEEDIDVYQEDSFLRSVMSSLIFDLKPEEAGKIAGKLQLASGLGQCSCCGAKRLPIVYDGVAWAIADSADPCPSPDGLNTVFELNVPSGRIVAENDLRDIFPVDTDHNVNLTIGQHLTTMDYAAVGLAHGFVGNSCPSLYWDADAHTLRIGNAAHWDAEEGAESAWGEEVGGICTDLWWYSLADLEEVQRHAKHYKVNVNIADLQIIEVPPGVYQFRHLHWPDTEDAESNGGFELFAEALWVREPDPVRDVLTADAEKQITALETAMEAIVSWPDLYGPREAPRDKWRRGAEIPWEDATFEQRSRALRSALNHILFHTREDDWHPNGFKRVVVSAEASQRAAKFEAEHGPDIPVNGFHSWSAGTTGPFQQGANVGQRWFANDKSTPLPMNTSFVRASLAVAQNILQHPPRPRLNADVWPPRYGISEVRRQLREALEVYQKYRELYPEIVVDEAFDRWAAGGAPPQGTRFLLHDGSGGHFIETTGARHWDGTRFLDGGLLADISGRILCRHGIYKTWASTDARFCLAGKDFQSVRNRTVEFRRRVGEDTVEVLFTSEAGRKRVARVPTEALALSIDEYIEECDLGPVHPPKKQWRSRPKVFELAEKGGFIEFDAMNISGDGRFAWASGSWAAKEHAERYALDILNKGSGNRWPDRWYGSARDHVPLCFVARIVKCAAPEGDPICEIAFDYGDEKMTGPKRKRWAIRDRELAGVRRFGDEMEYARLLTEYRREA